MKDPGTLLKEIYDSPAWKTVPEARGAKYEVFAKDPYVALHLHLIMNADMGDVDDYVPRCDDPDPHGYYWFGAEFDESDQQP